MDKLIKYRFSILVNKFLKFILGLALVLGVMSVPTPAQTSLTGRIIVGLAANRPTACISGDVYEDSDDANTYRCFPGNVWIIFGGGFNSPITSPNPLLFNVETNFKGPDPYTDVTNFNVVSLCNSSTAPCAPGITATISATSTTATLSSPSTFKNGYGVVIFGAGGATGFSPPTGLTVTPSIAAVDTGTGQVVSAPAGVNTFNYQIIVADTNGGYSAVSTVATTTTGGTLGAQSVAISGFTRAGNLVTATTSSAHTLAVGAMVYITTTFGATDNFYFGGWYTVASVPDNTHFTYVTGNDVAEGALATSGGGGTAHWFNCNHLSWTAVPGAYLYYIYGRSGGSLTLLGVSTPQGTVNQTTWDDFGATMMSGFVAPYYIPTTPPVSSSPDYLVTTIVAGGGTTSLTLANAAQTSVTNATILFDNTPNLEDAASHCNFGSIMYVPGSTFGYTVNSHLQIPGGVSMLLAGGALVLNDTLELDSGGRIYGMLLSQSKSNQQFGWQIGGFITVNRANIGVWSPSGGGLLIDGIQLTGTSNGQYLMVADSNSGSQSRWHNVNFVDGNSGDYMGVNLLVRGSFWNDFDHILFGTGPGQEGGGFDGSTATPAAIIESGGLSMSNLSVQDRGILYYPGASGAHVEMSGISRMQGAIMPFFTANAKNAGGGLLGGTIKLEGVELDTMSHAFFDQLQFNGTLIVNLILDNMGTGPSGGFGYVTGYPVGFVTGAVSGQNNNALQGYNFTNSAVNVVGNGEFMVPISVAGAPSLAVSAGGSVPVGNISYAVTFVDVNGQESTTSAFTNVTTTTGNQTVTVTPPAAPVGAVAWKPYRGNPNGVNLVLANIPGCQNGSLNFSQTFVDTFAFVCSNQPPSVNRAGAQSISAAGLSGTQINFLGGGFKSTISGNFTANRNQTLPDVSGTIGVLAGSFTNAHCLQANVVGGVLSVVDTGAVCGAGGGGATLQTNGTNNTSQTVLNLANSAATNGITLTVTNTNSPAGTVQLGYTGTLNNSGLTNSGVTINTASPLLGGGPLSLGGTLSLSCPNCSFGGVNSKTANYTIATSDDGVLVSFNGANLTATLPATPPSASWTVLVQNLNSTNLTVSRNGLNINGAAANITVPQFQSVIIFTDGTNYFSPRTPILAGTNILVTPASNGLTIAATGTGVGGSGTTGFIPKWSSSSNLTNSAIDDGVTTPATVTSTEPVVAPSVTSNGLCNSGTTGCVILAAGTAPTSFNTSTVTIYAPASITTAFGLVLPSASATGILHASNVSNIDTLSISAVNLASSDVTGNLPFSQISAGTNSNAGTFAMSSNTLDLSATVLVKQRTAGGLTTTVNGDCGYDTTNKNWHCFQNAVDSYVFTGPVSGTYTNNDCVKFGVTAGVITLVDAGSACGSGGGAVSSITGDGTLITNSASTGAVTLTLGTAGAHKWFGNNTGSTAAPGYETIGTGDLPGSGSITINGDTCTLGSTCTITLDQVGNPVASKTFTFPATNILTISGTAPASQSGAGLNAGNLLTVTGVTGSATTGNATTGGIGSQIFLTGGNGGSGSGGTNAVGGAGGGFSLTTGNGGASGGTAANANGGDFNLVLGSPGTGGSGTAGRNGNVIISQPVTTAVTNSPFINLLGEYQNSGTPTFAVDTWSEQVVIGAGTNGTSTLAFTHTGSSGAATASFPNVTDSALTSGQIVKAGAGGLLQSIDFPQVVYIPAADCVNGTAGSGWSTGATPAALCRAGTNNKDALLSPWGASDVGYFKVHLPKSWDTASPPYLMLELTSTDATNGHTIIMQESVSCAKLDGSTTDDVAFNAARSLSTITLNGNANRTWEADLLLNATDMTGCVAPSIMWVKISRTTDTATNVGVYGATVTIPQLPVVQAN